MCTIRSFLINKTDTNYLLILSYSSCSTPPVDIVTNAAEKNVKIATNLESALASLFRANQETEVPIVAIVANILRLRVGFLLISVKNSFARFESFPSLHLEKMNLVPDEPPFPILTTESLYVVSNTTLVGGPSCMLAILPLFPNTIRGGSKNAFTAKFDND